MSHLWSRTPPHVHLHCALSGPETFSLSTPFSPTGFKPSAPQLNCHITLQANYKEVWKLKCHNEVFKIVWQIITSHLVCPVAPWIYSIWLCMWITRFHPPFITVAYFIFICSHTMHLLTFVLFPSSFSRPLTLLPIQKCQNDIVALKKQLTNYASHVCSTCILEDVENHYWADPKPFYEVKFCLSIPHF